MPSIAQIDEGMPVLTNFNYKKTQQNDNERFQNGISNGLNNKHSDADNYLFCETNGNHNYTNGTTNGTTNGHTNGHHITNGNHTNGISHSPVEEVSVFDVN